MFREVEEIAAMFPGEAPASAPAQAGADSPPAVPATCARFMVVDGAVTPPSVQPPKGKPNPKMGIGAPLALRPGDCFSSDLAEPQSISGCSLSLSKQRCML